MTGQTIQHYKILEKLGEGGMGVVYTVEDTKLNRIVVLKFLQPHLTRDPEAKKRFILEAQAASALEHNNICTIHQIDETEDGQLFICMAHYEGETLAQKIVGAKHSSEHAVETLDEPAKNASPLPIGDVINLTTQIAQGLAKAHSKGIVHRDLKPANIMVTEDGVVKILDFGLAKLAGRTKLTKSGSTLGTVAYMSPEQFKGENVDHRADIWALGVVLYEMLAGELPFQGEYDQAVMYSVCNEEPAPISSLRANVPNQLQQIVEKALQKNVDARYQTVDEMLTDLHALKDETGTTKRKRPTRIFAHRKNRTFLYGSIAATLVVLMALGIYFIQPEKADAKPVSIAVLPMKSLTNEQVEAWFTEGMTSELTITLGTISGFSVISWSSMMLYHDSNKSLQEIAREVKVDHLVNARVMQFGSSLQIYVELIEAATGKSLWGTKFEKEKDNAPALLSATALEIAQQVQVKLTAGQKSQLANSRPVKQEAYEAYLKGRYFENRYEIGKAVESYQLSAGLDSTFAPTFAAIARCYTILGISGVRYDEVYPKAKAAAIKALELDSTLAAAYAALGIVTLNLEWDLRTPEQYYKKAIALNPNSTEIYLPYTQYLVLTGRFNEGIAMTRRAIELDPLAIFPRQNLGWSYLYAHRYDEAIVQLKEVLELDASMVQAKRLLVNCYVKKGMYTEALSECEKLDLHHACAFTYAATGKKDEAIQMFEKLLDIYRSQDLDPFWLARVYAALGEKDQAFRLLEESFERHSAAMVFLKTAPGFDDLHDDPRFADLLKRIGF